MSEKIPLPEELALLAEQVGASPSNFAPFDPSASIPLYADISGRRGHDTLLSKAAIDLYELLRWDDDLAKAVGNDVVFHNKKIGSVPNPRRPMSDKHKQAMETLLHSFAHIASAPTINTNDVIRRQTCVAIPLDTSAFGKGAEYEALGATAFRDVVVALAMYEWIDVVPAHYNAKTDERRRTRVRPKRVMFDWLVQQGLVFPYHPHGPKTSKRSSKEGFLFVSVDEGDDGDDGDDGRISIPLDRPLSEEEAILPALNDAMSKQRLQCSLRDYRQYENMYDFKSGKPRFNLAGSKRLRRVFTEEDGRAGRLYGHWVQRLPKELRGQLTINGQPTVELDYNGMQMALLYADANKPLPDQADLYAVPGFDRDDMKAVLLRTVGTASRKKGKAALGGVLHEQGRNREGRAEALYDAFWGLHADVCPHRQADNGAAWARLQELDSKLALRVLRKLLDKGITAIPIHDSFIIEKRHAETTKAVMLEEFEALFKISGVSVNQA